MGFIYEHLTHDQKYNRYIRHCNTTTEMKCIEYKLERESGIFSFCVYSLDDFLSIDHFNVGSDINFTEMAFISAIHLYTL